MRTVFLSSTTKDLSKHREVAYHAIESLQGYHCVRMEDFGSWDNSAVDFCMVTVYRCDIVVCIAGPLYGSLSPAGRSYTECEYDAAISAGHPCLIFLSADDFPLPDNLREPDDQRARQLAFRDKLATGRIVTRFVGSDELATKVIAAIRNWESKGSTRNHADNLSSFRIRRLSPVQDREWIDCSDPFAGIGRSPHNLVIIDDPEVSWEHGQIVRMKGSYYYRHLSATNPTVIERFGASIKLRPAKAEEVVLYDQDRIRVGMTILTVEITLVRANTGYRPTAKAPDEA